MSLVLRGLGGTGGALPVEGLGEWDGLDSIFPSTFGTRKKDATQGDPAISVTENGAALTWAGGQPVMDQGLENSAIIGLLTEPGWCGNAYLATEERIGSNFERAATRTAITRTQLAKIAQEAEKALRGPLYDVAVSVTNPAGHSVNVEVTLAPPGRDVQKLAVSMNGQNWLNQAAKG